MRINQINERSLFAQKLQNCFYKTVRNNPPTGCRAEMTAS
ncbi:hypothetical protein AKN40_4329 [Escherichia coli]|nr:hypothetical protein AKN40_4329 [Escherichia coli]